MKKKHLSFILMILLILALLPGCNTLPAEEDPTNVMGAQIQKEYDDLMSAATGFDTMDDYAHYLLKWASGKGIRASYDAAGNVIMSKIPSEGFSSQNSLNVSVPLNLNDIEKNGMAAAISLTFMDTVTENNFMRLIFTNDAGVGHPGATGLNKRFLNAADHIILDWNQQSSGGELSLQTVGAGYSRHTIEKELQTVSAQYPMAYRISLTGLQGGSTSDMTNRRPNPIKILGDLLATWKSEGILFELASFEGGGIEGQYPESASLTVLLNENDIKRFLSSAEKAKKRFLDDQGTKEPDAQFLIEETLRPEIVLDQRSGDSIVSLMYTLVNGVVDRNEDKGTVLLFSQMEKISTMNGHFTLEVGGRFLQEESNIHLNETLNIIAGLSEVNHVEGSYFPAWATKEDGLLMNALTTAASDLGEELVPTTNLSFTEASLFLRHGNLGNLVILPIHEAKPESILYLLKEAVKIKEPVTDSPS